MGLDIYLGTDIDEELDADYSVDSNDIFSIGGNLSRTFCNFMCRRNAVGHEPELEQIGRIVGIDITPLYEMENYTVKEDLEYYLGAAQDDNERQEILAAAEEKNNALQGNLEKVLEIVNKLIEGLYSIDNLPMLLLPTDFDSLDNQYYFADFAQDKGDGYIANNFGRDLRNLRSFLEVTKNKGATTVWFMYM